MMKNDIRKIFEQALLNQHFIRYEGNKELKVFLGKDEKGNYALEFRGLFNAVRIKSSDAISVCQERDERGEAILMFSLVNPEILNTFCIFCEDMLNSIDAISDDETAYNTLRSCYSSWKELFKPLNVHLSEMQIMGLIGELLFLEEFMIPFHGISTALDSWAGPDMAHKDFSLANTWFEVKTISSGKNAVTISSLEQLDSETEGHLAVYQLERMAPPYNGIKLDEIVMRILSGIKSVNEKTTFMAKLEEYKFRFSQAYNTYVYEKKDFGIYRVTDQFPRLKRKDIPACISKVQYDIQLSQIENFKEETPYLS